MTISVVCWRWGQRYGVEHVNKLRSMLARHLHLKHKLFCVTDDAPGLHRSIAAVKMWDPRDLGRARRLRMFGGANGLFGKRLLHLDIDCVIVDDITPLVDRPEPFVIWRTPPVFRFTGNMKVWDVRPNDPEKRCAFNTSIVLRDEDTLTNLWSEYLADTDGVETRARKAGVWTAIYKPKLGKVEMLAPRDDDQAVVSLYAREIQPALWTEADGVYKWGRGGFADRTTLPENARIVFANGSLRGAELDALKYPWVQEHWR